MNLNNLQRVIFFISMCFIAFLTINAQGTSKVKITIGTNSFVATTYNNATAKAFIALLPITVTMNELNGNEKYYYMSGNLPSSAANPSTINNGDLMLYGQNCLVLFYETFATSFSYTKIGYIENITGFKASLSSNNPTVTFERVGNTTGIGSIELNSNEFIVSNDGLLHYLGNAKRISLIDIKGRIVASTTSQILAMNKFPKGIYILKIEGQGQNKTRTIKFKY